VPAFVYLVVVGFGTYVATWASWFATSGGWGRQWGAENPSAPSVRLLGAPLAAWWHYQADIWRLHTGTYMATLPEHPFDAKPWGWLVIARPILFARDTIQPGVDGCKAADGDTCLRVTLAIGTPFLWWMAALALIAALVFWLAGRDWRFAVPLLAGAATWLGWFPMVSIPGSAGLAGIQMGGGDGWGIYRDAPPETVDFLKFISSPEIQKRFTTEGQIGNPANPGAFSAVTDPVLLQIMGGMQAAPYIQLWLDSALGPNFGGPMNQAIVDLMSGKGTPQDVVKAIQDTAAKQ